MILIPSSPFSAQLSSFLVNTLSATLLPFKLFRMLMLLISSISTPNSKRPWSTAYPARRGHSCGHCRAALLALQLVDVLNKLLQEGFLILQDHPLISTDKIVPIHLASHDFGLQSVGPRQLLHVSEEMSETVNFYYHVLDVVPFGDHNIADYVVEVVLGKAGHSDLQ